MEINDYNNKNLSNVKSQYNDAANETRKAYKNDLKHIEKNHTAKEKAISKNHLQAKLEIEEDVSELSKEFSNKTKEEVSQKQKEYREKLKAQKLNFDTQRIESKKSLDEKLTTISDAFRVNEKTNTRAQKQELKRVKENLNQRIQRNTINADDSAATQANKFDGDLKKFTKRNKETKINLVKTHSDASIRRDAQERQSLSRLKDESGQKLNALRSNKEETVRQLKDDQGQFNKSVKIKNELKTENSNKAFKETADEVERRNLQAQSRSIRERKSEIRDLRSRMNKRFVVEKRKTAQLTGDGVTESRQELENSRLRRDFARKTEGLENNLAEIDYENLQNSERVSEEVKADTRKVTKDNLYREESIRNDSAREMKVSIDGQKVKSNRLIANFREQIQVRDQDLAKKDVQNKARYQKQMDGQREAFSHSLNSIQKNTHQDVSDILKENSIEKTKLIEAMRVDTHNQTEEIKDEYRGKIERQKLSDKQKLDNLKRLKDRNEHVLERKLKNVVGKSQQELIELQKMESARKIEQKRVTNREFKAKASEHRREMATLKTDFDKKLHKFKEEADNRMTYQLQENEETLNRTKSELGKEMKIKLASAHEDFETLAKNSKLEKDMMIEQYEDKIQQVIKSNALERRRTELSKRRAFNKDKA